MISEMTNESIQNEYDLLKALKDYSVMKNEYTNASTTNLLNAETKTWDDEILDRLGIKKSIFGELNMPGTFIGRFTDEIKAKLPADRNLIFHQNGNQLLLGWKCTGYMGQEFCEAVLYGCRWFCRRRGNRIPRLR